jgi:hypothetical protein
MNPITEQSTEIARRLKEDYSSRLDHLEQWTTAAHLLDGAGLQIGDDWYIGEIEIERHELAEYRDVLGPLKKTDMEPTYGDNGSEVWVITEAENFAGLQIKYRTILTDDSPCRIVSRTTTYETVVCERSGK